jgi:hypothetical protein
MSDEADATTYRLSQPTACECYDLRIGLRIEA